MAETPEQAEPPQWHRLAREARASAENAWLVSRCGLALVAVATLAAAVHPDMNTWRSVATAALTMVVTWIRARRVQARADWLATTPNWWERLDEAPTLITFPRLARWLRRHVPNKLRATRYGYE